MVTTRYFDQRERLSDNLEVFVYDELPQDFRIKVAYLLDDLYAFLDPKMDYHSVGLPSRLWRRELVRALGVHTVPGQDIQGYFFSASVSQFFIGVEVLMKMALISIDGALSYHRNECIEAVRRAEQQINTLLRYYSLGYEITLVRGDPYFQMIRKDAEFTHAEMVKPALRLLSDAEFAPAEQQFRDAHREYQQGNYADAITDASASVESVLKVVLGVEEGTAKELLRAAAASGYFPGYLQNSVVQWENLLMELPTERNKMGDAHGKSKVVLDDKQLERHARLALNLAAAHILFIVDEYRRRKSSP